MTGNVDNTELFAQLQMHTPIPPPPPPARNRTCDYCGVLTPKREKCQQCGAPNTPKKKAEPKKEEEGCFATGGCVLFIVAVLFGIAFALYRGGYGDGKKDERRFLQRVNGYGLRTTEFKEGESVPYRGTYYR